MFLFILFIGFGQHMEAIKHKLISQLHELVDQQECDI